MGMTKGNIWAFWDGGMRRNRERQRSKDKKKKKKSEEEKERILQGQICLYKKPCFSPLVTCCDESISVCESSL